MVEKLLIPVEDEMNDHKRAQLQELYNLKAESFISSCSVCKEPGHNQLACPWKKTTLKSACDTCGSFSHPTSGCPVTPLNLKIKSSKEIDAANLYIGFLPQTVDDSRLQELFSPFGTITQSTVKLDLRTGYSMGYGFVRFDTPSAASLAIMHMNGYQIDGHRLRVRIAGAPPGQPATSHLPVYSSSGPAVAATSYPSSPHYMMPKAQVSLLNCESASFSSSPNKGYNSQIYQAEAPIIPQNVSGSSETSSAILSSCLASASTESSSAFSSTVATSSPTLPDCMMQEPQVSVLNNEGLGYPTSINNECLTNLYIGYLPQTVDNSRLWELFSPFGTITQSIVALDQMGYSKGYGFVRFDTPSAASLAIMHMNGCVIDGHRLTVKIADTPNVRGQLAANLIHVYSNPGATAVPTSNYPASPYYMMQKAQVSVLNGEGIGFPSSLESSNQLSQNEAEASIIAQEVSESTVSTTAAGLVSNLTESKSVFLSTSLVSKSSESSNTSSPIGLLSTASTELRSAYSSTVATCCLALPDYMVPQAQLSVLDGEGLGYQSSLNMEYLSNLKIGFLPQTVDDSRLWELFSPFGIITQLKVALDKTGYSKGYGFVKFDNPSAASSAIMHMNGYELDGHILTVKIAGYPPVRGQPGPATNLLHVYPNPGPAAVASYPTLPYYMMQKGQMSVLNGEGIGFPSSLNMESSNQFSQTEAPVIPQEPSGSTTISSTVSVSSLTESRTGLISGSTESGTISSSAGLGSLSTESRSASLTKVATSVSALPDCMMPEAHVSVLNKEGISYPSSQNMDYLTTLYVGFLPQTIDDSCLLELFSPFGTVTQSRVILDMVTGHSKGYGFVSFDSPSTAGLAISHMNGCQIDGHRLVVRRRIAGTPPPRGPPATSLVPVYSFHGQAIASSCPAVPMMPKALQDYGVSGSTGSSTAISSTAFVSKSTESGTKFSAIGVISGLTESRTAVSSTGLLAASSESRSVISSYSFSSLFCGDPNYPGTGF